MPQNINLWCSGLYTAPSDLEGLPRGSLDVADNVESRYKNLIESRRGFDTLTDSAISDITFQRLTNFWFAGAQSITVLKSDRTLVYYDGLTPYVNVPGYYDNLLDPDSTYAKSRFLTAGDNLYMTARDGVRSVASSSGSYMVRAGVPKGLNLGATAISSQGDFLSGNIVLTTTGRTTSGSSVLNDLESVTGVEIGTYVSANGIPDGITITEITEAALVLITTGTTQAGSKLLSGVTEVTGLAATYLVVGSGIPDDTSIVSVSGSGPYGISLNNPSYQSASGSFTFYQPGTLTLSANATVTASDVPITFYDGAQVGYRLVFGRIETAIDGSPITRLGAASSVAIAVNTFSGGATCSVTGTLPKNSDTAIGFYQLYRSPQTLAADLTPLDQYKLAYEADLSASDFTNRVIVINDSTPDLYLGIPLYSGSDQEGSLQSNNPPPLCYDVASFRDFMLYGNITQPTTCPFTILGIGSPSGVQIGDVINVSGSFVGNAFNQNYTASSSENAASRQFKVFSAGSLAHNIADTADSFIRVFNYDNSVPVHAILVSSETDLPGQMFLEADYPSYEKFYVNASLHASTAYDPALNHLASTLNQEINQVSVSKAGELQAVPATNVLNIDDAASAVLRIIPLRDYVVVIKSSGIYKIIGTSPQSLVVTPFDLTTKIIGPDTAVSLDSSVWMFSNQGVVQISDGGVNAKSVPIDDQLNALVGQFSENIVQNAFAISYESDRKYILCMPQSNNTFAELEFNFNYITQSWTTWSRNFYYAFIHSVTNLMYVSRSDPDDQSISYERKSYTLTDFADEPIDVTIISYDSGINVTLADAQNIGAGDILWQSAQIFAQITIVDPFTNDIVVQIDSGDAGFTPGAAVVLKAIPCTVTWKQVFGSNPALTKQFSEGVALFKRSDFKSALFEFATDFYPSNQDVTIIGAGLGGWGLEPWGDSPWGGGVFPEQIRFYIPAYSQIGSYLLPTFYISQAYSDFLLQGLAILLNDISPEVGR